MADKSVSFTVAVKDAATAELQKIQNAAKKTAEGFLDFKGIIGELMPALGALSIGVIVKDIIDLGVATDKTFRGIASNLPTFTQGIGELKESLTDLANLSGRSIEEIRGLASEIAKMGVSSAEDLKKQAEAATALADVSGTGLSESARLLIQLRREFGLTGEQALDTAAKLTQVGRGKVDIGELFAAFQRATPTFQEFGIDVDTATRAIIALVSHGDGMRQVGTVLKGLDGAGIRDLAAQAHVAGDEMADFNSRLTLARDGAEKTGQRIKNEFTVSLEDLAERVLPVVTKYLDGIVGLFDVLRGSVDKLNLATVNGELRNMVANYDSLGKAGTILSETFKKNALAVIQEDVKKSMQGAFGLSPYLSHIQPDNLASLSVVELQEYGKALTIVARDGTIAGTQLQILHGNIAAINKELATRPQSASSAPPAADKGGGVLRIPLSVADTDKITALSESFEKLQRTELDGTASSKGFTEQIIAFRDAALKTKVDGHDLAVMMEQLWETADKVKKAEFGKEIETWSIAALKASGSAIGQLDAELQQLDDHYAAFLAKNPQGSDTVAASYASQKADLEAMRSTLLEIQNIDDQLAAIDKQAAVDPMNFLPSEQDAQDIVDRLTAWRDAVLANEGESNKYKKIVEEVTKAEAERDRIQAGGIKELDDYTRRQKEAADTAKAHHDALVKLAEQLVTVGRSAIGAAQAIGEMSSSTAATLQNVVSLAEGIGNLFGGNAIQGITEVVASLGGLLGGSHGGDSAAQKAAQQTLEANTKALQDLAAQIRSGGLLGSNSLTGATSALALRSAEEFIKLHGEGVSNFKPYGAGLDAVTAAAKEYGITLDGTVESYQKLIAAIRAADPYLTKFANTFDGISARLDATTKLFGDKGPVQDIENLGAAMGALSPALKNLFATFDPSNPEGFRKAVQDFFLKLTSGGFTDAELGGMTGSQIVGVLEEVIPWLDQLAPALDDVAAATKKAADAQKTYLDSLEKASESYQSLVVRFLNATNQTNAAAVAGQQLSQQQELYGVTDPYKIYLTKYVEAAETAQLHAQQEAKTQTDALNAQTSILQDSLNTQKQQLDALKQVADGLKTYATGLKTGSLSPLSPTALLAATKAARDAIYAKALAGDQTAAGQFGQANDAFLTQSRSYNASSTAYVQDFAQAQQEADTLATMYGAQATAQQQMVDLLTQQLATLKDSLAAIQGVGQAIVNTPPPMTYDEWFAKQPPITSITDQFDDWTLKYQQDHSPAPAPSVTVNVPAPEVTVNVAPPEVNVYPTFDPEINVNISLDKQSFDVPTFAAGGSFSGGLRIVGERGPELEWTRPSHIFNADLTRQLLGGGGSDLSSMTAATARAHLAATSKGFRASVATADEGNAAIIAKLDELIAAQKRPRVDTRLVL